MCTSCCAALHTYRFHLSLYFCLHTSLAKINCFEAFPSNVFSVNCISHPESFHFVLPHISFASVLLTTILASLLSLAIRFHSPTNTTVSTNVRRHCLHNSPASSQLCLPCYRTNLRPFFAASIRSVPSYCPFVSRRPFRSVPSNAKSSTVFLMDTWMCN